MIEQIIDILRHRRGKANAITARDIAVELARRGLATTERGVRDLISEAEATEQMPLLLGGRGGEGFYVVENYDEIAERAESLRSQIQTLTRRLNGYVSAASGLGIHVPIGDRDAHAIRSDRTDKRHLGVGRATIIPGIRRAKETA
jgi:hypothetical protein